MVKQLVNILILYTKSFLTVMFINWRMYNVSALWKELHTHKYSTFLSLHIHVYTYLHTYIQYTWKGMHIRMDYKGSFQGGAYKPQSISTIPRKKMWFTRLLLILIYSVVLTLIPEIPSQIYEPPTHIPIVEP